MKNRYIRYAEEKDVKLIYKFIEGIAGYEKMLDELVATEELLHEWIFNRKIAEVIFAVCDGKEVGFALFFYNFSTFVGKAGIYLEDLYVLPEYRGAGFGKLLFKELAKIAVNRDCGRYEWCCLNWNRPSIDFYLSMGAEPMSGWTTYRLSGEKLRKLAES